MPKLCFDGFLIKKFLEIDYSRGRALEVFRRFHTQSSWAQALALGSKTEICYFPLPQPSPRKGEGEN